MPLSHSQNHHMEAARARASFYNFITIHFLELPDEAFAGALREAAFASALEELEHNPEVPQSIVQGAALMRAYLTKTAVLSAGELARQLGLDRTRLYRGISPGYGPVPPYEALWTGKGRDSAFLQEMARSYREGGFILGGNVQERLDYLGVQLHYLERLVIKETEAWERGNEEAARTVRNREREFLHDHPGRWVPDFVASALTHAQTDFYRGHLHQLAGFLEGEKEVLGL